MLQGKQLCSIYLRFYDPFGYFLLFLSFFLKAGEMESIEIFTPEEDFSNFCASFTINDSDLCNFESGRYHNLGTVVGPLYQLILITTIEVVHNT